MIDSFAREKFQHLLIEPPAAGFVKIGISHHLVTAAALLMGLSIPYWLYEGIPLVALLSLLVSGYLDALDGSIARLTGADSPLGCLFDIVADRAVEAAILIGLFLVSPEERALATLLMMASVLLCITSFLCVGIFAENEGIKSFHYSPGLMERSEAFLFFGLMIAFPSHFLLLSTVFTALVLFTAIWRIWEFYQAV